MSSKIVNALAENEGFRALPEAKYVVLILISRLRGYCKYSLRYRWPQR